MSTRIQLSDHFNYGRLLRFTIPSIAMMLFTSIYGVVDGFFVSNMVGKTEFAALNLIWPYPMVLCALGFMFGVGGTALVAKTLGEGDKERANRYFSLLVYFATISSTALSVVGFIFMEPVSRLLGAEGEMLHHCMVYGRIIMAAVPTFVLQMLFQPFMVTAEKPRLGFWMTLASGLTNIVFDILFIGVFHWGLVGAAAASALSQVVGCVWPIIYFALPNDSLLRLGRASRELGAILRACLNGLSELVTNVSLSVVCMVYNFRLLAMVGEDGVAVYGVIMYVSVIFLALFFGYCMGVSPVVSYHFGAGNRDELRNLRVRSLKLLSVSALVMGLAAIILAPTLAHLFVGYEPGLCGMTVHAFRLYALSYFVAFINIFASDFFTALNDGVTSAIISFSRMLLFQIGAVLLLPVLLGLDGVWIAMLVAEILSMCVTLFFFAKYKRRYGY